MKHYTLGIDVGGTKTAYGLYDMKKKLIQRMEFPTDDTLGPEDFFTLIANKARAICADSKLSLKNLHGIGIGVPSFIDYDDGYIVKTSMLPLIKDFHAKDWLSKKLDGIPIVMDNDARTMGLAELIHGAGQDAYLMVFCPVSTGFSSQLFIEGEPFRGSNGWAGETGHMIATPGEGILCGCGNQGCYVSWASGGMIVKHIQNWIAAGEKTIMAEMAGGAGKISTLILNEAHDQGDPMAIKALDQMIYWLGVWFYNLYMTYNVDCFVLGGGLTKLGEKLLDPVRQRFDSFNHEDEEVEIKIAECGDDGGILGASELVHENILYTNNRWGGMNEI